MDHIQALVAALDAGIDIDELVLGEQVLLGLRHDGVDDEGIQLAVCCAAIRSLRAVRRLQAESN